MVGMGFNYNIVYSQLSDIHRKHGSDGAYGALNLNNVQHLK